MKSDSGGSSFSTNRGERDPGSSRFANVFAHHLARSAVIGLRPPLRFGSMQLGRRQQRLRQPTGLSYLDRKGVPGLAPGLVVQEPPQIVRGRTRRWHYWESRDWQWGGNRSSWRCGFEGDRAAEGGHWLPTLASRRVLWIGFVPESARQKTQNHLLGLDAQRARSRHFSYRSSLGEKPAK